ncbi:hypothetical protein EDB86DRAFT_3080714 [Lactarius hatsudake]|nr:hypothetical protein EDB86DRAFT_3080714 [Lactarius hatsudake]
MDDSSDGPAHSEAHTEYEDFGDGANALWTLYGKEAQIHDKARFENLAADMNGVPTFAGLFAAVLTSFLVQSIQNLQISQQIASIAPQVSIPPPPPPYPAIPPSSSDIRVNVCWLIGLVCSLSAALFAILVQHWVRSYMQVFQRYDHPLKRARFRQFYFEGAKRIQLMADTVPMLMHFSLFLFFGGLGDFMLSLDTTVGVATIVPASLCGVFYLSDALSRLVDPRSPNHSPILRRVLVWAQNFPRGYFNRRTRLSSMNLEIYREHLVMGKSKGRKSRDVRALQWLVNNTAVKDDVEPLALAIPGSFNTEWGREVWRDVSSQGGSHAKMSDHSPASSRFSLSPISQRSLEGAAVNTVLSLCYMEKINEPPTSRSDQSFTVRWTCLSLMAAQQTLRSNPLQVLARYTVNGLARIQPDVGEADEMALKTAEWIDEHLKIAWDISFSELKSSVPFPITEVFNFTPDGATPVTATPHFIFLGPQVQALAGLSYSTPRDSRGTGSNGPMTRQLWRLQDLRDGGGLGFTVELFFLSLQRLPSTSPSQEPDKVFYAKTFRKITSRWMESRESLGTQNILLNIICDLVIQSRGMFSDFSYPEYITNMLLELIGHVLRGNSGPDSHVDTAMQEIESVNSINCIDLRG